MVRNLLRGYRTKDLCSALQLRQTLFETSQQPRSIMASEAIFLPAAGSVQFAIYPDGYDGARIIAPGPVELHVGASSGDIREVIALTLTGSRRVVGFDRALSPRISSREE